MAGAVSRDDATEIVRQARTIHVVIARAVREQRRIEPRSCRPAIRRTHGPHVRAAVRPSRRRPASHRPRRRSDEGPAFATQTAPVAACRASGSSFRSRCPQSGSRRSVAAHLGGMARQHDRGFDRAAVNAVAQFLCSKQAIRYAEARPRGGDREHAMPRAQILRHHRHRGAVAAVTGHHHDLSDSGPRHVFAERGPGLKRCLVA